MRKVTVHCSTLSCVVHNMRVISLICFVGCVYNTIGYHLPAPLDKHGVVVDTPEVAAAKHDHYATLTKAGGAVPQSALSTHAHGYQHHDGPHEDYAYHGPPAPLNHDGTVAETLEVAHVKHERLAALAEAFAKAPRDEHHGAHRIWKRSNYKYHGPPAPLNHDGTVAETPEVAHVKHERLAALAEAFAKAPQDHHNEPPHHDDQHQPVLSSYAPHEETNKYHGPPAPLNHDGTVAETPEVAHVKHERLAALHEAFAKAPRDEPHHSSHSIWKRSEHFYHGPPAPLNHDGTVAETPEVAHVKHERLAALAEAFAHAPNYNEETHTEHHPTPHHISHDSHEYNHRYHGPPAPLNHDGTVAETPEVRYLKSEHFAAHAKFSHGAHSYASHGASSLNDISDSHEHKYHGPPAPLNHDGTVAETPEVSHVKHERLAALHEAFAKAPRDEPHHSSHSIWKRSEHFYYGPPAPLNHDGTVAETPEVAHVKHERLAALAEAFAHAPHDDYHEDTYAEHHPAPHHIPHDSHDDHHRYNGPSAPLNHDGTVAEAPEVKHLKSEHFAVHAKLSHGAHSYPGHLSSAYDDIQDSNDHKYHGPPAPLNHDGTVAETPEVKHVKASHLAAVAEALAKAPRDHSHHARPAW